MHIGAHTRGMHAVSKPIRVAGSAPVTPEKLDQEAEHLDEVLGNATRAAILRDAAARNRLYAKSAKTAA